MGSDIYLIRFQHQANLDKVLNQGLGSLGNILLLSGSGNKNFKASTSSFLTTTIWAHLPELPLEFYDPDILTQVDNKFGHTSKIDASTHYILREKYVRLCIQVDIQKPLKIVVYIGHYRQQIIYEGLNYFTCGCVGHKSISCKMPTTSSNLSLNLFPLLMF